MKNNSKRTLKSLNLIDSFLFSYSTEDNKNAEFISRLIIERATGHTIDKVVIETEKELKGLNIDERGIRLDICVSEMANGRIARVYDIEPNKYESKELFHRSRYYQSLADAKRLMTNEKFNILPDFISIWILTYDPFNQNRMIYSVKNMVTEDPELMYNDGAMKLFLYTGGEKGGSKELKNLLNYLVDTREENAVDNDLLKLQSIVSKIKHNKKVGEQFMIFESDLDCEKRKSHEEGHLSGRIEGIISSYRNFNATDSQIISALMKECNLTEEEATKLLACNL